MSSPAISVENLSKAYRIGLAEEIPDTITEAALGWLKAPVRNWKRLRRLNTFAGVRGQSSVVSSNGTNVSGQLSVVSGSGQVASNGQRTTDNGHAANPESEEDTIWALRDVSFDVQEGEVVGIIGRNGAGKSTLLKILSRITEPTSGRAVIRGRVSSLLEVGTGFHPELTGRENIYMNGTILGMTKREIDRKFDEIVDFSGVEKFLDTPIKRYSSGMKVRLAFSVAAHLEPEILIIDEVLAVGDAEFQKKCLGKMQDVATGGRTVLFVSHNMAAVESLCDRGVQLKCGSVEVIGSASDVIQHYRQHCMEHSSDEDRHAFERAKYFEDAFLLNADGNRTSFVPLGGAFHLNIVIRMPTGLEGPVIGIGIDRVTGERILTVRNPVRGSSVDLPPGRSVVCCTIPSLPLAPGGYTLKLVLAKAQQHLDVVEPVVPFTVVDADGFSEGRGFHRGVCVAPSQWYVNAPSPASVGV